MPFTYLQWKKDENINHVSMSCGMVSMTATTTLTTTTSNIVAMVITTITSTNNNNKKKKKKKKNIGCFLLELACLQSAAQLSQGILTVLKPWQSISSLGKRQLGGRLCTAFRVFSCENSDMLVTRCNY